MTADPLRPPDTDDEPAVMRLDPDGVVELHRLTTPEDVAEFRRLWHSLGARYVPLRVPPDFGQQSWHNFLPDDPGADRRMAGVILAACFLGLVVIALVAWWAR